MSKKFLTKLLALTLSAGLIMQPATAFAEEIYFSGEVITEELPDIENVQLNENILSWDAVPGAEHYLVSIGAQYQRLEADAVSVDLHKFCEDRELDEGTYTVLLGAYDSDSKMLAKVAIIDYKYVASGSGIDDPIPELIEIPDQVLDGDILSWGFSDGIESYNLSIGSDGINIVENSRNLFELCNEFGLEPGNYVVTLTGLNAAGVCVTPEYSHEYTFAPLIPGPQPKVFWLDSVDATSDLASLIASRTHSDPNIKAVFSWTEFSSTWEMYDPEKDMWEDIDSEGEAPLEAGTYRIKTYMSPAMTHVRLESGVTLTVDGQSWERQADVQYDVAWFQSPTFVISDEPIIDEIPIFIYNYTDDGYCSEDSYIFNIYGNISNTKNSSLEIELNMNNQEYNASCNLEKIQNKDVTHKYKCEFIPHQYFNKLEIYQKTNFSNLKILNWEKKEIINIDKEYICTKYIINPMNFKNLNNCDFDSDSFSFEIEM